MKIGINSRLYQNEESGIPTYIKQLYTNIIKFFPNNEYVFFQTEAKKTLGETKTLKLPSNHLWNVLFDTLLINPLINKERINIFHGPANILPLFKFKHVKYVVTIHDLAFLVFPQLYPRSFKVYFKRAVSKAARNADLIVTVSESTKKDLIKFYKVEREKIKVIYSGIDNLFFKSGKQERLIRNKYFFSITTHPKRKNIHPILELLANNKSLSDFTYVIAGIINNQQRIELENKIKSLSLQEKVILFGFASTEELINLYQNAEFFIYPSFYEGFGFPVLEAMACCCPVITSNTSSLKEITPNKEWLVDPNNAAEISNQIERLLNLSPPERANLIENNYNFAKRFTWKETAIKMMKEFSFLLQEG